MLPERFLVFVEIRDETKKEVTFSAFNIKTGEKVFQGLKFEESWWISLSEVAEGKMILTVYNDTNNPDKKSVIVYDYERDQLLWWKNNYSFSAIGLDRILLSESGVAGTKFLVLNLTDGQPGADQSFLPRDQNFSYLKPLQYYQENGHFETVKSFLRENFNLTAIHLIEYLEFETFIIISCYSQEKHLANYLFVLTSSGELLLKEKIADELKGIGVDTFFLFSGYLIFVKNKSELVSIKLV